MRDPTDSGAYSCFRVHTLGSSSCHSHPGLDTLTPCSLASCQHTCLVLPPESLLLHFPSASSLVAFEFSPFSISNLNYGFPRALPEPRPQTCPPSAARLTHPKYKCVTALSCCYGMSLQKVHGEKIWSLSWPCWSLGYWDYALGRYKKDSWTIPHSLPLLLPGHEMRWPGHCHQKGLKTTRPDFMDWPLQNHKPK